MGAPIIIGNSHDIWISNALKDAFCDVMTHVAALEGLDIMAIYEEAPGVAGTYGVTGVGIAIGDFDQYLGGREGVRRHINTCQRRLKEVAAACWLSETGTEAMAHILAWVAYHMDGNPIPENCNLRFDWPPGYPPLNPATPHLPGAP
ncbi:hypothetical protein [Metapseudomonas otitidis]|uniref:Uncharacterized protein n=1 Tax=Metapseudomonas otitidis TaxID=319939 RepID=A0A679GED5_9GAMM|nr:hypothetical protein [Pseudomonas otitidis]BCA29441.1 hypothetical protein PtoMrB4_34180 [Pseudomonas otitidis]